MINAIFSSDNIPLYKDFEPYVSLAWKKIGINPFYVNVSEKSDFYTDKVPIGNQAQIIRVLLPALYPEEIFITADIDMLPMSKNYFIDSVNLIKYDNEIINLSADAYDNNKKYPICYWISKGKNFKLITGVRDVKDVKNLMEEWYSCGYGWNTDEECFSRAVNNAVDKGLIKFTGYNRGWPGGLASKRIDRANWNYDIKLIENNHYIDSHMVRPLHDNFKKLKPMFNALDLNLEKEIALQLGLNEPINAYSTHLLTLHNLFKEEKIKNVFEFGCGMYSTFLFADKCETVISIEMQNEDWFNKLKEKIPNNVTLLCQLGTDKAIDTLNYLGEQGQRFDLIFVDGHGDSRWKAINMASKYTNIIVAHDTEYPGYRWDLVNLDESWNCFIDKTFSTYTTVWKKII